LTKGGLVGLLLKYASGLRFPTLFLITLGIFVVDVIVPDVIPLADELLLGMITLLLGTWKKRRSGPPQA